MLSGKEQKKKHHIKQAFLEFQTQYLEVKIKQQKFDSLKPFFVRPATEKDRRSCLSRKNVETQIAFKDYEI